MQDYPKALYLNGLMRQVDNFDQEQDAREEGFMDWAKDHHRHDAPAQAELKHEATPAPINADPDPSLPPTERNKPGPKPKAK